MTGATTGIELAVKAVGSQSELARRLCVSRAAVNKWLANNHIPPDRVLDVERVTGVDRQRLWPEMFAETRSGLMPEMQARGREMRLEAAARGLKRYDPQRPCARGHEAERYVINNACIECMREDRKQRYAQLKAAIDAGRAE